MNAYCTACGAQRVPLTGTAMNLVGRPSKMGGAVARGLGWATLVAGLLAAAFFGSLLAILGAPVGLWLGIAAFIAIVPSLTAWVLLRGGSKLKRSGEDAELAAKHQAVIALARARDGVVRAWDVAQSLQLTPKESDELLTRLAKEHPEHVSVDIDEDGALLYRFPAAQWGGLERMAPNAPAPTAGFVRVDAPAEELRVEPEPPARVEEHGALDERLVEEAQGDELEAAQKRAR